MKNIVLTGGPCAGKSSAISKVVEFVSSLGIPVVSVPEGATELMVNGITLNSITNSDLFQELLIEKILSNEKYFGKALNYMMQAANINSGVMICDRGISDCLAYADIDLLARIFDKLGLDFGEETTKRYAAVIAMRTAPEEFYTLTNNIARRETYEEACALDEKTSAAWLGHPSLAIVGNDFDDFDSKVNAVIQNVAQLLGVPKPIAIERKYLVRDRQSIVLETFLECKQAVRVNIVQHYLAGNGEERVRAWTRDGVTTYFHTKKSNQPSIQRIKTEKIISPVEYEELLRSADPMCAPIEKVRHYFIDNDQYFRLDTFPHNSRVHLLEVQPTTVQEHVTLPDCLSCSADEVTSNPWYYNYNIAKELAIQRRLVNE